MCATAVVVLASAVPVTILLNEHSPSASISTQAGVTPLHDAVGRGTLVKLDRRTGVAEFRLRCGWNVPKHGRGTKLRPGLYTVSLRGAYINSESGVDPAVPGSGVANHVSVSSWERWTRSGWKGLVSSESSRTWVSDGPSTDVCHGHFG